VAAAAVKLAAMSDLDEIDRRSAGGLGGASEGSLEALLGVPRAVLLQRLDAPATAGDLAAALHAVPSAATHHIAALERAGLARRERSGRQVLVWRTKRGTALLELYGLGSPDRHSPSA
jgi:DNA-binding transcriptional ArsR family regulator